MRMHAKHPRFKEILLTEIIARTIKNELRCMMRETTAEHGSVSIAPPRELILDYYNLLVGTNALKRRSRVRSFTPPNLFTPSTNLFTVFIGVLEEDTETARSIQVSRGTHGGRDESQEVARAPH